MIKKEFPILEFDKNRKAVINPGDYLENLNLPERCVLTFFTDVIKKMVDESKIKQIAMTYAETVEMPIYEIEVGGEKCVIFNCYVGAPISCVSMEELIYMGCKKFIVCGGAGALQSELELGKIVIPTTAIRDEGLSYHYIEPSREINLNPNVISIIEKTLNDKNISYLKGKTWTTDAIFRETNEKVELRKSEGCITVEMECAAFAAVSKYRGVEYGQILYCGDDCSGETWDDRGWSDETSIRERLLYLAVDCCLNL